MKRIVVTGGCGFIGRNLIRGVLRKGNSVRVLDNLSVGRREDLQKIAVVIESSAWQDESGRVSLMVGDIRDKSVCERAVDGADAVVHLAAQCGVIPSIETPLLDCETNVLGSLNLLQSAVERRANQFILASSSAPLGETTPPVNEEMVPHPLSPYGASKLAGEGYCSAYYHSYNLKTICLRFSNVYGPGSGHKGSVVAHFFTRALEGLPLVIYGTGNQTRDFIYVDDLCLAIEASLDSQIGGEIFQIATSQENTIMRVALSVKNLVERDTGRKVEIRHEPERKGEIVRSFSDISKAQLIIGYTPAINLEEGMERTWAWFKAQYNSGAVK